MATIMDLIKKIDKNGAQDGDYKALEDEDETYTIKMTKEAGGFFGIGYRVNAREHVYITSITPLSIIEEWNGNCEVDSIVCAGDRLIAVNRQTTCKAICEEMKTDSIEAIILKSGPRWHINGVTADSMEKIGAAQNKGLAFELQDVDQGESEKEMEEPKLNCLQILTVFLVLGLPNMITIGFFSDIGYGFKIHEIFAPYNRNMFGNGIVFLGTMFAVGLYVADWTQWPKGIQKYGTATVVAYLWVIGAFFKMRFYPEAPLVITIFHIPILIGVFRATVLKQTKRRSFYLVVSLTLLFWGFLILFLWLAWILTGEEGKDGFGGSHKWEDSTKMKLVDSADPIYEEWKIKKQGATERRTLYEVDCDLDTKAEHLCTATFCSHPTFTNANGVQIATAVVSAGEYGLFCCPNDVCVKYDALEDCVNTKYMYYTSGGPACCDLSQSVKDFDDATSERADNCAKVKTVWFMMWVSPMVLFGCNSILALFGLANGVWLNTSDSSKLEKIMKQFTLMSFVLILMIWVSVSIAGASMRLTSAMIAFCVAGLVALSVWVYLEIGSRTITISVQNSRLMQQVIGLATSDWVRAMMIIALNMLIPLSFAINAMNQSVRRVRGATRSESRFTDGMQKVIANLKNWNWCSILVKVNWLCIAYWVMSIGVAKFTTVFLAWLNEQLLKTELIVVIFVFWLIGFLMFMAPPVPGLPVYMCSGIVLASRARDMDGVGFGGGCAIACVLSFILKLSAVAGQYGIGFFLGKSIKVQQAVGVDKVFIKAVQLILEKRGIPLSKVAVLVGGPDWPTSVLCGILRLSLPQCILGTVPVIFVSSPVVLAGAFMAGPNSDPKETAKDDGIWGPLKAVMMGIAALGQLASGVVALYYIQDIIYKEGKMLEKPRPEHEAIAKLTRAEQEYVKAYNEVLDWSRLSPSHKPLILASTITLLLSNFCFVFMDEACFITGFEVTGKIGDPIEDGGLDGMFLNIVKPIGWLVHAMFFAGTALHLSFLRFAKMEAQRRLIENKKHVQQLVAEGTLATESEEKRKSVSAGAQSSSGRASQGGFQPPRASQGMKRGASKEGAALY